MRKRFLAAALVAAFAFPALGASIQISTRVVDGRVRPGESHPDAVVHEWDRLVFSARVVLGRNESVVPNTWRSYLTLSSGFGMKDYQPVFTDLNYVTHRWPSRGFYRSASLTAGPFYSNYSYAKTVGNPGSTRTDWWRIDDRKGTYTAHFSVLIRKLVGYRRVCIPGFWPIPPMCYWVPEYKYYTASGSKSVLVVPPEYDKTFDPDLWGAVAQVLQFMRHRALNARYPAPPAGAYMLARKVPTAFLARIDRVIHSYYKACSGFLCIAEAVPGYNLTALFLQTSKEVPYVMRKAAKSYCGVAGFGRGDILCLSFGSHGAGAWLSPYPAEADVLVLRGPKHSWLITGDLRPGGKVNIFRLTRPSQANTIIDQIFYPTKNLRDYAHSFDRLQGGKIDLAELAAKSRLDEAYGPLGGGKVDTARSVPMSRAVERAITSQKIEIDLYNEKASEADLGKVPGYVPVTPAP